MKMNLRRLMLMGTLFLGVVHSALANPLPVRVTPATQISHTPERQIPGRIEAIHTVELRARTEGVINRIHFRDGQYVNKGELLFELDDAAHRATLRLAKAELSSVEATLRQSQQLLTRYQGLKNNHSISQQDVDNARMQRDVSRAAVEQAKARIEAINVTLGYTRIHSPLTGRIGHSQFHVGSLVGPSSGVLAEVVQLDPVRIAFALEEHNFVIKADQHADITAMKQAWQAQIEVAGERETGELTSVDNRVDPRTASVMLRAEFANPRHLLLPGGNTRVWLRPQMEQEIVTLPVAAIQQNSDGFFAWVIGEDERAEKRLLTLAEQVDNHFQVLSGVAPGELVVVEGAQRLFPGAPIQRLK